MTNNSKFICKSKFSNDVLKISDKLNSDTSEHMHTSNSHYTSK